MNKRPMRPRTLGEAPASAAASIQNEGARTKTRREMNTTLLAGAALAVMPMAALAQEVRMLPDPRKETGKPLMQALQLRRSIREFSPRPLPAQLLSDLLWAAYGINRPSGDRTAPYWRHIMVIEVYAVMADGVWLCMTPSGMRCVRTSRRTSARRLDSRTSLPRRRLTLCTWLTARS
jgi:hypothetical protein